MQVDSGSETPQATKPKIPGFGSKKATSQKLGNPDLFVNERSREKRRPSTRSLLLAPRFVVLTEVGLSQFVVSPQSAPSSIAAVVCFSPVPSRRHSDAGTPGPHGITHESW